MRSFFWFSSSIAFLLIAAAAIAQITICQGCGWEVGEGLDKCGHCSKAVERKAAPADQDGPSDVNVTPGPESEDLARVDKDAVAQEVKLARDQLKAGDFELARLFLKNASVLNLLSDPAGSEVRGQAIAELLQASDSRGLMVQAKCSTCGGKGNRVMKIGSLVPGEEQTREVQGSKCQICKGAGIVRRAGTIDERKFSRGQAATRYATIQQGRRYMRLGGAWLPPGVSDVLSTLQRAVVMRATASPCEECAGFGKTDCGGCEAGGVLDCEACEDGNVFIKVNAELTKMTLSRSEKCKKCRGKGMLLCSKCGGSGGVLCRECNGSGSRPACKRCSGEGHTSCRKCRGAGTIAEEDCEDCGREGAVLCKSCNGDGRR